MPAAPHAAAPEQDDRVALAELMDRYRGEIIARWAKVLEHELRITIGRTQLEDAMPDYLARLAEALRSRAPLQESGAALWADVAREHALTRVRLGFDIEQLVREFIVLRQVISDISREQARALDTEQAGRVADLVEAAISVAVRSYVEARDYAARQKEAEHISFITHELRNPLSTVKLAAARLRRLVPSSGAHLFELLERNIERLAHLIESVLHVERLEAGKVQPHPIEVELGELLDPSIASAKMAAEAKGVAVRADFDPHLILRADPELAGSAISNVVDNAVKFTDSGEIRIDAQPLADRIMLHVRDNCPGLSEKELRVVFEPFERGHVTHKPGSGLGLAIARRAVEAQGGAIGADSSGDRGCHFWIALPRVLH